MKRGLIILVLALFLAGLVPAFGQAESKNSSQLKGLGENFTGGVKNLTGQVKEKAMGVLEKEITIPDSLQMPVRILFGIKREDKITIERFVVLIALWVVFFLIMLDVLKMTSFSDFTGYAISFFMIVIMGVLGIFKTISEIFFLISNKITFIQTLGPFSIFFPLLAVGILWFILSKASKYIQKKKRLSDAKEKGERIVEGKRSAENLAEINKRVVDALAKGSNMSEGRE